MTRRLSSLAWCALLIVLLLTTCRRPWHRHRRRTHDSSRRPATAWATMPSGPTSAGGAASGRSATRFPTRSRSRASGSRSSSAPCSSYSRAAAVAIANVLDDGLLPYTTINGSAFPAADPEVIRRQPKVGEPEYHARAFQFVRETAPDTWQGMKVNFFQTFIGAVRAEEAFPEGGGSDGLLLGFNLEIWGLPTSKPTADPTNANFVYQRFQRGIMHYDAACKCTQGLLLADYLKSILTLRNLPPDLEVQALRSPFYGQLDPGPAALAQAPERIADHRPDRRVRRRASGDVGLAQRRPAGWRSHRAPSRSSRTPRQHRRRPHQRRLLRRRPVHPRHPPPPPTSPGCAWQGHGLRRCRPRRQGDRVELQVRGRQVAGREGSQPQSRRRGSPRCSARPGWVWLSAGRSTRR